MVESISKKAFCSLLPSINISGEGSSDLVFLHWELSIFPFVVYNSLPFPHFSHFSVICLGVFPYEIILHVLLVSVNWWLFFILFRFRTFLTNVSLNIPIFLILFLLLWNFVHSFFSVSYTWFYIFIPSPPIVSYPSLTLSSIFFIPFFSV